MNDLTTIDLGDGDRRLSELVRHVEETGEGYLVTDAGRPVARLLPAERAPAVEFAMPERPSGEHTTTPEQEAALERLLSTSWDLGIRKPVRDEVYNDRMDELDRRRERHRR